MVEASVRGTGRVSQVLCIHPKLLVIRYTPSTNLAEAAIALRERGFGMEV
jgi:hypothetical protein